MADHSTHGAAHPPHAEAYDEELNSKAIYGFGITVGVLAALGMAIIVVVLGVFKKMDAGQQVAKPVLVEAQSVRVPPEPRLQPGPYSAASSMVPTGNPPLDMEQMRAEEKGVLTTYAWVDKNAGVVRVPVDRAMDALVAAGSLAPEVVGGSSIVPPAAGPAAPAAAGAK